MSAESEPFDWSAQAGDAATTYESFLGPAIFAPFAGALLDVSGVREGSRVLDVACGTGVVAREAARRAGASGSVTGVDMAPPMLAVARDQATDDGAAPISYLQGDAAELPVEDESADVVSCHQGLQFFPDKQAALAEMRRALVPGGRVAIGTWTRIEDQPHFAHIERALVRHLGAEQGGGIRMPFALADPWALGTLLDEAGFFSVDVARVTLPVTFSSASSFGRLAIGAGPLAPLVAGAGPDVQETIYEEISGSVGDLATRDDRLLSSMTSLIAVGTA